MLEMLAAANAAFAVIKKTIENGRDIASCGSAIAKFTQSEDQLQYDLHKKKNSLWTNFLGKEDSDLEEFMALEQIREKEEELKKIMIYLGRPGLWQDWQRFQAEARKSRRYQEKMAEKRKQELIEYAGYGIAFIFILFFAGILAWLLAKWMGKL